MDDKSKENLSILLKDLNVPEQGISLKDLDAHFGDQGTILLIILLAVPFLFPVPIPGFSTLFGFGIIALVLRTLWPNAPMPVWLGRRIISQNAMKHIIAKCGPAIARLESWGRSDRDLFFKLSRKSGIALLIIFSALLLALPIPPIIPFTNTFPAIAIILLAFGQWRRDALVILGGGLAVVVAATYFIFLGHSLMFAGSWLSERLLCVQGYEVNGLSTPVLVSCLMGS